MKSHASIWIDAITDAVRKGDQGQLEGMAAALMDAEAAKTAMRTLGYGQYGQSLTTMISEVPNACGRE